LLRGDAKSRAEYYASGIVNGWLTRNEARKLEDFDPLDGLDEPLVPLNMGTKSDANADPAATAADQKMLAKAIAEELGIAGLEGKIGRVLSLRNEKPEEGERPDREVLDQVDQQAAAA
jgi:hypothetical protein